MIRAIAVYTGASAGTNPHNTELAQLLGTALAHHDLRLVYGGGQVGLMGTVSDAALDAGGSVTGVIPEHLVRGEIAHPRVEDMRIVASMHERKQLMIELSDAFVCLPGGAGTLDELFDTWTTQQLGLHAKPIALFGREYWQPLLAMLDHMVAEGLVRAEDRETLVIADDPAELFDKLATWQPPKPKWSTKNCG